jgi:hypothetical protein
MKFLLRLEKNGNLHTILITMEDVMVLLNVKRIYAQGGSMTEPVAYINVEERKLEWATPIKWETPTVAVMDKVPLYTAPPQRDETSAKAAEWVGLTDEDVVERSNKEVFAEAFARGVAWAELKLKEKNT